MSLVRKLSMRIVNLSIVLGIALVVRRAEVSAWVSTPASPSRSASASASASLRHNPSWGLFQSSTEASEGTSEVPPSSLEYTKDEEKRIEELHARFTESGKDAIMEALPTLHPGLVVKLRQSANHANETIRKISTELNSILDESLQAAKVTLKELLDAGEIRKLDSLIGQAASSGQLNAAFFNVLSMNLKDAMENEQPDDDNNNNNKEGKEENSASRVQILKHIYTRCQEEVEKTVPAGYALLNKLLRTEQASIRANLYKHYLTPQENKITTPDGKQLELKGPAPILVPLAEFIQAVSDTVLQIRTVEKAAGIDRESAAAMVESCRQVAKEARMIIGESYGVESDELATFEKGLQAVFRPSSPDSPYIQGQ